MSCFFWAEQSFVDVEQVVDFLVIRCVLRECEVIGTLCGVPRPSLLLTLGLLGSLGDFATSCVLLGDGLDDTDGHGLPHVAHGETPQGRILGESLDAHRLLGLHIHHGGVTGLDVRRLVFQLLARTTVDLLLQLDELAGDVRSVAI